MLVYIVKFNKILSQNLTLPSYKGVIVPIASLFVNLINLNESSMTFFVAYLRFLYPGVAKHSVQQFQVFE